MATKDTVVPIWRGVVADGKPKIAHRKEFLQYISQMEGKQIELTVKKKRKRRSDSQNAYYFGVVLPVFAESIGYTIDELHEALKWKFLNKPDQKLPTVRSTSTLNSVEFGNYLDQIIQLAGEYGVTIPAPDSVEYAR